MRNVCLSDLFTPLISMYADHVWQRLKELMTKADVQRSLCLSSRKSRLLMLMIR